eukprot:gene29131-32350_t
MEGEQVVEQVVEQGEEPFEVVEVVRVIGKRCFVGNLAWKTSWQDLKDKFRECGNVVYANVMREDNYRSKGWGIVEYENVSEAEEAINTLNGFELDGRRILVREDREDRDIKPAGERAPRPPKADRAPREDRSPREDRPPREDRAPREPRAPRGGGRGGGGRDGGGRGDGGRGSGRGRGRGGRGLSPERTTESSGLQVVVQGIPWAYTWRELKDMFVDIDGLERADVTTGFDGRSRGYGTVLFATPEGATAAIDKWQESEIDGRKIAVFLDKYA